MKRIFAFLILGLASMASTPQALPTNVLERAYSNLLSAAEWSITSGIPYYYLHEAEASAYADFVREAWAVTSLAQPIIHSERFRSRFVLVAAGFSFDVINLYGATIENHLYESWIIKISGNDVRESFLFITRTSDPKLPREIILKQSQFIETFEVAKGERLTLPISDPVIFYDLSPWSFPSSYRGSDLPNYWVIIEDDGTYKKERISLFNKLRLQILGIQ